MNGFNFNPFLNITAFFELVRNDNFMSSSNDVTFSPNYREVLLNFTKIMSKKHYSKVVQSTFHPRAHPLPDAEQPQRNFARH